MLEKDLQRTNRGWRRLITPHPAIAAGEERRKAQLVITLALAILFLTFTGILIVSYRGTPVAGSYYPGLAGMIPVLLIVYGLSLTRHYREAIWLLLVSFLVLPLVLFMAGDERSQTGLRDLFLWAVLSVGVGGLLLPVGQAGIYAALIFVGLLGASVLAPADSAGAAAIYLASFAAIAVLFVVGLHYRSSNAAALRVELADANRRLQTTAQELESSMAGRTADVARLKAEFDALTVRSPLAIMRFDRDLRLLYANLAARRIFALQDSDADPNAPFVEQPFDPEMATVAGFLTATVLKAFDDGQDIHTQSAAAEREFEWWLVPERNPDGGPASVLVTGMDVSEQRRSERQAVENEARFRAISDASPLGIYVDDPGGTCVYYNHMFQIITGLSDAEIAAGRRDEIIHPEDRDRLLGLRAQLLSTAPYAFESVYRFLRSDGRVVWVNSKEAPMWDGGNLIGFVGVVEDITAKIDEINARLESEESLRRRSDELENALGELEGFSYTVAHDLRAPLRAIDGFANIMQREYRTLLPMDGMRLLETIRKSAQQMGMLIDDLLSFSRLGRQSLNLQLVEMNELLEQVLDSFSAECQSRDIRLKIGQLMPCYGDSGLLRQVWINLLSNAIKFTRHTANPVIEIGCTQATGKQVAYFVKDNGAGFDMAFANKLFGVFQRLHRADEFEGTGVGLAIVQRVVQRHEGKVWANGTPGHGATFYFSIPSQPKGQPETSGNGN